jgi:uncharacterized membrane protein
LEHPSAHANRLDHQTLRQHATHDPSFPCAAFGRRVASCPGVTRHAHDMSEPLQYIVMAAIVGSGLMSGLLLAFSVVVMRALSQIPPEAGMLAMQRINVLIINPVFMVVFLGTAALCLAVAVFVFRGGFSSGALPLLSGALAYLLGPLGTTIAFNVPLNNRLAVASPGSAATQWPKYVSAWLVWNHVRTALGILGTTLLALGLAKAAQGA